MYVRCESVQEVAQREFSTLQSEDTHCLCVCPLMVNDPHHALGISERTHGIRRGDFPLPLVIQTSNCPFFSDR